MELSKKNFHMSQRIVQAVTQITQDADASIPEGKPGVGTIILKTGDVRVEEVKPLENKVLVRGGLDYQVLYSDVADEKKLSSFNGTVSFEESIQADGTMSEDDTQVDWEVEDLSVSVINSNKLNIRSILTVKVTVNRMKEEEIPVEITSEEPVEYRKKPMDMLELAVCKKDIFRVREEMEIPSNLPNAETIVWDSIRLGSVETKALDGKISIKGELFIFILYEAEGEDGVLRWYDSTLPFAGTIDCRECLENDICDTTVKCVHQEIALSQDMDGENRIFSVEAAMELFIHLYEEKTVRVISDVYGVTKEITPEMGIGHYRKLLCRNEGKYRGNGQLKEKEENQRILQICHSEGNVKTDDIRLMETGIMIEGVLEVQILYITDDDKMPFHSMTGNVPFLYLSELSETDEHCIPEVKVTLDQLMTSITAGNEIEVKPVFSIHSIAFCEREEERITGLKIEPLDKSVIKELPPMAVCFAQKGDSLWQFGKEYYVPVSKLKEMNGLTSDEIKEGDRIIIVK